MRKRPTHKFLLPHAALLTCVTPLAVTAGAASFDLSVDRALLPAADAAIDTTPSTGPVSSGIDVALRNRLFSVAVDYDVQVQRGQAETVATRADTEQHVGASLNSALLNDLLRGDVKVDANSVMHAGNGAYNHRIAPAYSRKLLNLATLNLNYQYLLQRPSARALPQAQHAYSLGLTGSLYGGRLNWSGLYSAADIYRESAALTQSSESFQFHSDYQLLPQMQLNLNSAITERTSFTDQSATRFIETRYGAGLSWKPSEYYSLDFSVSQTGLSDSGEETLLRKGTVSWFPRQDLSLSLDYGDTLVEGTPGVLLNTRLDWDRF